ncbi:MAG: flagellar M-ring protein FliF [Gammaproteobacteria bacterium]|nr:flagellar M-ring protein FliF [Gammaproteobacteria bacterium]MBP6480056.1 flagellar M-ring protein FliF [Pseudomonadales bacterium]MBP7908397.1 flagellar M-ring protein FliF [Pseudomonadales bacterium]
MADTEQDAGSQLPAVAGGGAGGSAAYVAPLNPYVAGIAGLSIPRQVGVIVGLAASVALAVWLVLWTQGSDMRPLYGSLENLDAAAVVGVLESNGIRYRIDENSGALLVESARFHDARLLLAEAGMPNQRAVGFEMLDKEQGIGTSQFMETARYRHSLEGELARTIGSIASVRAARVHLAIPERSAFVRDQRRPSASVLLELQPGRTLQEGQVRAIGNLVASSVPDLDLADVTIVDQKGKLVSNFGDDPEAVAATRQLAYTAKLEDQLVQRVHRILDPIVGGGRYKAEVTADVDFTAVEQTDEIYNPDLPALRSERRLDEQRVPGDAGAGIPGALSNQPPVAGAAPEVVTGAPAGEPAAAAAPRNVRTESTRNYEVDRSLSHTRHQVGNVRRLTVAVVLDDRVRVNAESGERENLSWDDASLERVTTLVRDAVGYDPARGDSVNVVNAAFFDLPATESELEAVPFWQQDWFLPVVRQALAALLVLAVLLAVVRPVLRSLSSNVKQLRALEDRHREERLRLEATTQQRVSEGQGEALLLAAPGREYRARLSAVQSMVESDAERVAQVVRKWVRDSE